jgi:hypothetical protein
MDTRDHIERLIKKIFECPDCHGGGGYTDVILPDGSGPHYTCEICNGYGSINIFKKVCFLLLTLKWKIEGKFWSLLYRSRSMRKCR